MFQIVKFLKTHWPKASALYKFLRAYNYPVAYHTVFRWYWRGNVPGKWAFLLPALLEIETGHATPLACFVA